MRVVGLNTSLRSVVPACGYARICGLVCVTMAGLVACNRHRSLPDTAVDYAAPMARLLAAHPVTELRTMPPVALGDLVYHLLYNGPEGAYRGRITQADYAARLHRPGRSVDRPPWHIRYGSVGTADLMHDARRFYFDVRPDDANNLVDALADGLDRERVARYSLKIPLDLPLLSVTWSVLFVEGPDFARARGIAESWARAHPHALGTHGPPFALALAPGLWYADEPGSFRSSIRPAQSFGGVVSDLIAEAILSAPANVLPDALAARVRAKFRDVGLDPERPWLRPGHNLHEAQ